MQKWATTRLWASLGQLLDELGNGLHLHGLDLVEYIWKKHRDYQVKCVYLLDSKLRLSKKRSSLYIALCLRAKFLLNL